MKAELAALVRRARERPGVRVVAAVQKRYADDSAGVHASAIAFHAFFSLLPLFLVALSILGFVLAGDEAQQRRVAAHLSDAIPGMRSVIGDNLDAVVGARAGTGLVGLLCLVWTGTAVVKAAGAGVNAVMRRPSHANALASAASALGSLGVLGALALGGVGAVGAVSGVDAAGVAGIALRAAGILLSFAFDLALFLTAYRLLAHRPGPPIGTILPGATLGAVVWTVLKLIGTWYAQRTVAQATAVYGTFAGALGLLVMLSLGARLFMVGAVVNAMRSPAGTRRAAVRKAAA